jgi:hypothetical protein
MSTAKAKRPGAGVKASPDSASPDQRQSAAMWSPFPPIAHYGVRVGLPYRHAGRSWNLSKYDDHCVRSKDTCCCWS